MKRLLVIFCVLLLLAAGGGAAWWFFIGQKQGSFQEVVLNAGPHPGVIEFEPFVVPVFHAGEVTHHLTMSLKIEVTDEEHVDRGEVLMPRLKDSILTEFQGLYAMRLITDQGFDTPLVRKRIKVASERVLGSGVVTGIDLIIAPKRKPSKA
jgi:flagellar basal body-associated protein FliL